MAKNKHINDAITPSAKIILETVSREDAAELFLNALFGIGKTCFVLGFNIVNNSN